MQEEDIIEILDDFDFSLIQFKESYKQELDKQKEKYNFDYSAGCTKIALFFPNIDFVIKIPFRGWNDIELFQGTDETWDYCELEEISYDVAKQSDLQDCLVQTKLLCYIQGYPIYKQPIVTLYNNYSKRIENEQSAKIVEESSDRIDEIDSSIPFGWSEDVVTYFGKNFFSKLLNFLSDMGINDMHADNVGYFKNKPIILDYSGYYEY